MKSFFSLAKRSIRLSYDVRYFTVKHNICNRVPAARRHCFSSKPSSPQRMKVRSLLESSSALYGSTVRIQGWVRTMRDQKNVIFIEVNDGSSVNGVQVVVDINTTAVSHTSLKQVHTGLIIAILFLCANC